MSARPNRPAVAAALAVMAIALLGACERRQSVPTPKVGPSASAPAPATGASAARPSS